ncbi:MAG: outer membrane beta-barrel protein [Polyangiaceae bacterium]|nr:outer membrane beta-barrel protein [Polyangiaceae bacterium]
MRAKLISGALPALLLAAAPAGAVERQWHAGFGLGAAAMAGARGSSPMAELFGAYGLNDMFDARLELGGSTHDFTQESEPEDRTQVYSALAGLRYNLDVIEWVPHFGIALGYYRFSAGPLPEQRHRNELGFAAQLGLDYLFSREVGAGVELAYHGFLLDPPASLGNTPMVSALISVERRWGW